MRATVPILCILALTVPDAASAASRSVVRRFVTPPPKPAPVQKTVKAGQLPTPRATTVRAGDPPRPKTFRPSPDTKVVIRGQTVTPKTTTVKAGQLPTPKSKTVKAGDPPRPKFFQPSPDTKVVIRGQTVTPKTKTVKAGDPPAPQAFKPPQPKVTAVNPATPGLRPQAGPIDVRGSLTGNPFGDNPPPTVGQTPQSAAGPANPDRKGQFPGQQPDFEVSQCRIYARDPGRCGYDLDYSQRFRQVELQEDIRRQQEDLSRRSQQMLDQQAEDARRAAEERQKQTDCQFRPQSFGC